MCSISSSSKTEYSTPQIIFLTQQQWCSIPSTDWLFLPNLVAAQLWNSPSLPSKNYSWLLPQQQIFWNRHSIEAENLWSLNVMPVQWQFTFYPRTQYDWINNGGHTYKNTTHQNITMHYLQFIFLNCTAVMPPTLPLTFRCLRKFQFTFTWSLKIYLLTHCGRVTQICVFTVQLCKTDDANLRFYHALGYHALYT